MKQIKFLLPILCWCMYSATAQESSLQKRNWKDIATKMPKEWYGSAESIGIADSILTYQTVLGGWPKNQQFHRGMDQKEWNEIQTTGIGATIDNGATTTELIFLQKMYQNTHKEIYLQAILKGINYILMAQYPNGGWPQFYPIRQGKSIAYNSHITYNDNAMVNVLLTLQDVIQKKYADLPLGNSMEARIQQAITKGIDCILNTQIKKNGERTVWCAQHDEKTLEPANARAFELASFSGQESAGIVLYLMQLDNPTEPVITAVKAAVKWFNAHKIEGIRIDTQTNADGQKDRVIVQDVNAPTLWARFYDLKTEEPFFCDRDGIKKKNLADIGYERRNGYSWYGQSPGDVIRKYPEWCAKWKIIR